MIALSLLVALLAGAFVTLQTGSNARLKEALGQPLHAVAISSLIGIGLLCLAIAVTRPPLPSWGRLAGAPWTAWLGGVLGAVYAITVVVLAHQLGAVTLTALIVTGQLVCSVVLDHFGLLGFELHVLGAGRIISCALLLAGTALIWRF